MKFHPITIDNRSAHWFQFHDSGLPLHFYHANAYPFGVYRQLFEELSPDFATFGLANRATWEDIGLPPKTLRWSRFADDLIEFLDKTEQPPVIGMGHSLGAVSTMLAASKRPELFRGLVLIDPVFFSPGFWVLAQSILKLGYTFEFIKKTLHRPDTWASRQACIDYHKPKKAFLRFSEEALRNFAEFGLTQKKDDLYQLAYPKEWEAYVYKTAPYVWKHLRSIKVPVLAIRGQLTDTLRPPAWEKWKKSCPDHTFVELSDVGHLAPLENPKLVSETIKTWASNLF